MTLPLVIRHLDAGRGSIRAVRDLSLEVAPGEVVALLGPNGAGKTTTLLTVSGLLPVLAGEIDVLGAPVASRSPQLIARAGCAHVPEGRSLFAGLTAWQNVALAGGRDKAAVSRALDYFPALEPHLGRRAGLLSGGQQQMLALARALATKPRLLMVDEMSLGLAPLVVEQLLPVLRAVADDTGCGVVLVEQHIHLALEIADRAFVIAHGDVVASGTAREVRDRTELVAAGYLGGAVGDSTSRSTHEWK